MRFDSDGYQALRTGAALFDSRSADWVRVSGADRVRFVNGLVTCNLRSLEPGSGAYGFFTDPKGKVLADAAFLAGESDLTIELPPGSGAPIAGHMAKYLVADQVEIDVLDAWQTLLVAGPEAAGRLAEWVDLEIPLEPWSGSVDEDAPEGGLVIRSDRRLGVPAWVISASAETLRPVLTSIRESGLPVAQDSAVRAVRIESGIPSFVSDFSPRAVEGGCFPQETGLESWAVSYEKGCYLGQEVIARIHFRGKVNRSLRGLVFDAGPPPGTGTRLLWNGEPIAVVNSVAESPMFERALGLAIVHHKVPTGSKLTTEDGTGVQLVELPFDTAGS